MKIVPLILFFIWLTPHLSKARALLIETKGLQVSISTKYKIIHRDDPLIITAKITNTTLKQVKLHPWTLPNDEVTDNFIITYNSEKLPYEGTTAKRLFNEDNYIYLAPNESLTIKFSLDSRYDLSKVGKYTIQYKPSYLFDKTINWPEVSNSLKFEVIENRSNYLLYNNAYSVISSHSLSLPQAFTSQTQCLSDEETAIQDAIIKARALTNKAYNHIRQSQNKHDLAFSTFYGYYTGWFSSLKNTIRENYTIFPNWQSINLGLTIKTLTYSCGSPRCKSGWFAFINRDTPYKINFCDRFWSSSVVGGYNTQAGTIIHEFSHFYQVINSQDHAYGYNAITNLVKDKKFELAQENADTYQHYAEYIWDL